MKTLSFEEAVEKLQNLELLVYPTETFFAVGGSALSASTVTAVYKAKKRDKDLPLPVIIGDLSQLEMLTGELDPDVEMLIGQFWPGPLTIIVPAGPLVPPLLTAGTGRVAVRLSAHFEASSLAQSAGFPIISSSANLSGRPPVISVEELDPDIINATGGAIYAEGMIPSGGAPTTIVELCGVRGGGKMLHVLREGAIPASSFIKLGFACNIK